MDPLSVHPGGQPTQGGAAAIAEVIFHSDLSRIGDTYILGAGNEKDSPLPVPFGRDVPLFMPTQAVPPRNLQDPCLSRHQAALWWMPQQGLFHVKAVAEARRPTRLLTMDGQPLTSAGVEPGTLVAFGDRVLLLLHIRPQRQADSLGMIGNSGAMAALRHRIQSVAGFNDAVLIQGETGSGKELVAQAIHRASPRARGPFVALNCAALPENLIESELFGYARGAFSGATQGKAGLFRAAEGGTLFLDEIGEMPMALQAKLLRVLEVKKIRPIGAQGEEPADVRIVAATHRDLLADVRQGRFREDLYARLESPRIGVPSLRERPEDIPLLFSFFLGRRAHEYARQQGRSWEQTPFANHWREANIYPPPIPMDYFLWMLSHGWPRNVRELDKFAAEMAAAIVQGQGLPPLPERASLPPQPRSTPEPSPSTPGPSVPSSGEAEARTRQRPERPEMERVLEESNFNQTDAARLLGVSYATMDRWMRELGVVRPKDLSREEILSAMQQAQGDAQEMARLLRVSLRGLKVRLKELGLAI
jgi:transcriptional regulator with PAS, ATPase and Fis domain